MASKVALCAFCNGPLVVALGSVTCGYCGKPNNPTGLPSKTQLRQVVREVVNEDLNQNGVLDALENRSVAPPSAVTASAHQSRAAVIYIGALVAAMLVAGAGFAMMLILKTENAYTPTSTKLAAPLLVNQTSNDEPAPQVPPPLGTPQAYWMDKSDIYVASEEWIAKVSRSTLALVWKTRRNRIPGSPTLVRLVADRVFVTSALAAEFYLASSGVETGTYRFRDSSFPPNAACAIGNQVLIATSFQPTLRLDALTARKTSGKGSCSLDWWRYISCPIGQTCSQRPTQSGDLQCGAKLSAKGKDYTVCETDDGGVKRSIVKAMSGGKTLWTSQMTTAFTGEIGYLGLVDNTLVIGSRSSLQGLAPDTGNPQWSKPGANYRSIVHSDDKRLYYADKTTFNIVAAASGQTIATLLAPAAQAELPLP